MARRLTEVDVASLDTVMGGWVSFRRESRGQSCYHVWKDDRNRANRNWVRGHLGLDLEPTPENPMRQVCDDRARAAKERRGG